MSLDPCSTYTKLPEDYIFPLEGVEMFKPWHDAALKALRIKDAKIHELESLLVRYGGMVTEGGFPPPTNIDP